MSIINLTLSKGWIRLLIIVAALMIIVVVLSYFISSDLLRNYIESRMNSHLKGYTVRIEKAYFHPINFSLDLDDLILTQNASPEPPVASIQRLHAGIHWRELLSLHLVADFLFEHPDVSINLINLRKEAESKVPFKEKGWQEALESIYPLKINVFEISDGELIYQDKGPFKPLRVSRINLVATNIRNISSPDKSYPSPFHLEGNIFDNGKLTLDGDVNFLEEPHLGVKADLDLSNMDLSYFEPILQRSNNILIKRGSMSANGSLEYNPHVTAVNLKNFIIKGVYVDYLHLPKTAETEQTRIEQMGQAAKELSNAPAERISVDVLKIEDSSFGYVNNTANPHYRLFIDHTDITIKNFSNQFTAGPATMDFKGKFMGGGDTDVTGTFRPETKSPDFNIQVAIKDTPMTSMNDLFRNFGKFDIKEGLFSFYSVLVIKDDSVTGYVKPLFKGLKVYDTRSATQKKLFHKIYLGLVNGIADLLENSRKEIATETVISGPLEKPKTSTSQIVINLIRNAFIKSILPGFENKAINLNSSPPQTVPARSSPPAAGSH